jgi:Uma2 family endonuclease
MTIVLDRPIPKTTDQLVIVKGDWAKFKLIQQGCEESPGILVSYFDGTIEIVMPSRPHEIFSGTFHLLLSLYLAHLDIECLATGSADQEVKGTAAAQPDQSYCIDGIKPIPDLSIEVVFSSGGINKLARYQAMVSDRPEVNGVPEVWFWEDGVLALYHLRPNGYEKIDQSELLGLSNLNLNVFKRCLLMGETSTTNAIKEFSTYLQQQGV